MSYCLEDRKRYDLYIILSDDILVINRYKEKVKKLNKVIIITKNKDIQHIIKCVNITKNMYYLYSSNEYLVNKFKKVYESNIAKYN